MSASFKQLEALHWVARLGSFQAAAVRLHTTQSAISKRIAELESISGKQLFDRTSRSAQLTQEGRRLAAGAEEILALNSKLLTGLTEPQSFQSVFRLGATELIGMTWLSTFVQRVKDEYPGILIEIDVDHGGRLLEKLNQGKFDLALVPGPMWGRLFKCVPLLTLDRSWLASPALGIPKRVLTVEELTAYSIVSQYPDTVHAQMQRAWFHRNGYLVQGNVRSHNFTVLGEMVMAGLGVGQLPVLYYADALRRGLLVKLRVTPALPNVRYFAVYRQAQVHQLAPRLARLAKTVCDFHRPALPQAFRR